MTLYWPCRRCKRPLIHKDSLCTACALYTSVGMREAGQDATERVKEWPEWMQALAKPPTREESK